MIWKRQRDNEGNEGKCEESIVLAEKKILRRRKQLRKAVKMTSQQRAEGFKESERPERTEGSETNRAETSKQTDKITDN